MDKLPSSTSATAEMSNVAVKVYLGCRACAGRLWWRCGYHATGGACLTDFGTTGGLWLLRGQGWEAWWLIKLLVMLGDWFQTTRPQGLRPRISMNPYFRIISCNQVLGFIHGFIFMLILPEMIQFDKHVIHLGVLTTSLVKCWLVLWEFSSRTKEGMASTSRHRCDLRCTFIGGKVHRMGFQGEMANVMPWCWAGIWGTWAFSITKIKW